MRGLFSFADAADSSPSFENTDTLLCSHAHVPDYVYNTPTQTALANGKHTWPEELHRCREGCAPGAAKSPFSAVPPLLPHMSKVYITGRAHCLRPEAHRLSDGSLNRRSHSYTVQIMSNLMPA